MNGQKLMNYFGFKSDLLRVEKWWKIIEISHFLESFLFVIYLHLKDPF